MKIEYEFRFENGSVFLTIKVNGVFVSSCEVEPGICFHRPGKDGNEVVVVTELKEEEIFWVRCYPSEARYADELPEFTFTLTEDTFEITI